MDINKYKNDGWGISKLGFKKIHEIILNYPEKDINCVEFGSGISTELVDKNINILSFDNDKQYMYKPKQDYDFLEIKFRELVECDDAHYNSMFDEKTYKRLGMHIKTSPLTTRQKNNFYDIQPNDLDKKYDFVLLDGPNGNGRNLAYLHLINKLNSGAYVFVDDHTHYDFVDKLKFIFDVEEIFTNVNNEKPKWTKGGDFAIFRVK
jgi:hypothetical protein